MDDQVQEETWHNLSSDNNVVCWPRSYSSRKYGVLVSYSNMPVRGSKADPIWTQLWRKLKRKKKRVLSRGSSSMRFAYDECSYSQNFDPGFVWSADQDDLSRSFSARFAVPSRIFEQHRLMV